ncbi:hypothetical protein ACFV42_49205, partial [Streptomyces solisilvae]|uniref:hypothetical protein n=2 Tax=Streptomyces TaxID=1883 RepID=UPI00367EC7DF
MATDEEQIIRANDGQYFIFLEQVQEGKKNYATCETFPSFRQAILWAIGEMDYFLSNDTVKEANEITSTGGVAIIDLPVGSLTIHRSDNRGA